MPDSSPRHTSELEVCCGEAGSKGRLWCPAEQLAQLWGNNQTGRIAEFTRSFNRPHSHTKRYRAEALNPKFLFSAMHVSF
jgi:hypothetical protein